MVFVKVREVYDLHTLTNKVSAIAIHTPGNNIIKQNYPGLLMQCRSYRPVSCDVKVACASMLPADPLQVSTTAGDIAPEDLFNPILYKACTNFGMSQIESRLHNSPLGGIAGPSAEITNNNLTTLDDEFNVYYAMLADTHQWRHANPQAGFEMRGLKPLVYEVLQTVGDNTYDGSAQPESVGNTDINVIAPNDRKATVPVYQFRGHGKPMPFINCTAYTYNNDAAYSQAGFNMSTTNCELDVPSPKVIVGCIIVPPSRLHQLFYRMVVEWTLEFSTIRSINEITNWSGMATTGVIQHLQSYSYSSAKAALGIDADDLTNDTDLVSTNADIKKVM